MQTLENSAQAYDRLSMLTDEYDNGQARLQELRVLTRALRILAVTYATEANIAEPMGQALNQMMICAGVERNRLYAEQKRQIDEMDRLNALIQNGAYNGEK